MAKSRRSKGKDGSSIFVIIAVLALLVMIGVAIYKLSGQHGNGGGNKTCASFPGSSCQPGTRKSSTTKCKTQQCTAEECCTPPTCQQYTCTSGQPKSNPGPCLLSGCTDTICCDKPKMCSDKDITCSKRARAVDTSKQCKNDTCTEDECCTIDAWAENEINKVVSKIWNCQDKNAAYQDAKAALTKGCTDITNKLTYGACLVANLGKAEKAAEKECDKPK